MTAFWNNHTRINNSVPSVVFPPLQILNLQPWRIGKTMGCSRKLSTLPPWWKFLLSGGRGEKNLFLIIVSVLGYGG
jgi:hypothetical protein